MRALLVFLLGLSALGTSAQDLTGIWRGHFKSGDNSKRMDSLGIDDRYKFETQIEQNDKSFLGVTYSYKTTVFYGKASCYGAINPKTKKVLLEENRLLEVKSFGGGACLMTLFLQYSKVGNEEFLEGKFSAISSTDSTPCAGGTVFLRKVVTTDFYKEPFLVEREEQKKKSEPVVKTPPATPKANVPAAKKPAPAKPLIAEKKTTTPGANATPTPKKQTTPAVKPPPAKPPVPKPKAVPPTPKGKSNIDLATADTFKKISPRTNIGIPVPRVLETRVNELVKTITTPANSVSIKIYDNGSIDNDTVSVYVDNKLVISRQRLTDKALTVNIALDEKVAFHELVMVAENLGEIPPNTSLMVVNAGDQQYEVRITSTEQKNAVVHFRRTP